MENSLLSLNHQSASSLNNFAAVLVALFIGRHGDTYVLLSQRSQSLRSYAGDTSLPGGKVERGDRSIEDVAVSIPSSIILFSLFLMHFPVFLRDEKPTKRSDCLWINSRSRYSVYLNHLLQRSKQSFSRTFLICSLDDVLAPNPALL